MNRYFSGIGGSLATQDVATSLWHFEPGVPPDVRELCKSLWPDNVYVDEPLAALKELT